MKKIKVLSLFSGIGAFEKALKNIGVDFELINYCEINKYASRSYSLIHNVNENLNLGDITKIDIDSLSDFDLLTHGSPCQSFSIAGKQEGGDKGSGTRSSLMWHTVEIIKNKKPKYVVWKNVKNVLSKNHIHNFENYISELDGLGYKSYYKVLNSCNYGIPQNRERIFVVSILGKHNTYEFPKEIKLTKCIRDILEENIDNKYYMDKPFELLNKNINKESICKQIARLDIKGNDCIRRVYDPDYCSPTLSTCGGGHREAKIFINNKVKKLTPLEYWRLQSFDDEDFNKCKNAKISNSQLYKQAGNSITVKVLEYIFKNLFKN